MSKGTLIQLEWSVFFFRLLSSLASTTNNPIFSHRLIIIMILYGRTYTFDISMQIENNQIYNLQGVLNVRDYCVLMFAHLLNLIEFMSLYSTM